MAAAASGCLTCDVFVRGLYKPEIKDKWYHDDGIAEWDHEVEIYHGDEGGGWVMVRVTDAVSLVVLFGRRDVMDPCMDKRMLLILY